MMIPKKGFGSSYNDSDPEIQQFVTARGEKITHDNDY